MKINSTLTILLCCLSVSVHAQVISRLTAQANFGYDSTGGTGYIPKDSSVFNYSYSRGSDMKTNLYLFDTSIRHANQGSGLALSERYLRTYDDPTSVRVATEIKQEYVNGAWKNSQRTTYHYPAAFGTTNNEKKDTITVEVWNNLSNDWYRLTRTSITYNANKDVTEELFQRFNNLNQTWDNDRVTTQTYIGGKITSRLIKEWNNTTSAWNNTQQITYTYSSNNLTNELLEVWDKSISAWMKMNKTEYTYNGAGENTSKILSRWIPTTSSWLFIFKNDYEYTSGNVKADTFSSWDDGTSMWTQNWLYTYTYDNNKNLLTSLTRSPGPDSFLYYRSQEWTYNSYNQPTRFIASEWDFVTKMWVPMNASSVLSNYYYTLFNVGVRHLSSSLNVNVFPVPAQNFLVVGINMDSPAEIRATLYDMQGRMVKYWTENTQGNYQRTVPVSELPNGVYILQVKTGNKELTKTLSIQR
ncbi:MAG: T9SS type A sorting domain-containing protein [Sphingobacteriales bacterium]|nr:MAG: T9SS type A sorting domain-containing protein [Sphingobacteriales bacterium]